MGYRVVIRGQLRYIIDPVPAPRLNRKSRFNPSKTALIERYHAYRDLIRVLHVEIPDSCFIRFEMPVPKRRHDRIGRQHTQRPDLDNLLKGLLDSVFAEDAHVHRVLAEKVWALRGAIIIGELVMEERDE